MTELAIGAAIEVHRTLGPGLMESVYEACLCQELIHCGLSFERQAPVDVVHRGVWLNCGYRIDLLVDERLVVEVKATDRLPPIHEAQILTSCPLWSSPLRCVSPSLAHAAALPQRLDTRQTPEDAAAMTPDIDPIPWPAPSGAASKFVMPPKLTISITETCPLNCAHCYADCNRAGAKPELSTAEWKAFIDHLVENGVIQMYFEGGEPFHRPDFHDLLAYAAQSAMTLVRTHGTTIDEEAARRLRRDHVGRMFVDVMGADAETSDRHTGVSGSFDDACRAVRNLVAAGVTTDMLAILTRQTAPQLQRILELAHDLGAQRLGVLRLYPLGRAKSRWAEMALSLDEQMAAIASLRPPPGIGVMQSWHPNDRNCCWQAAAVTAHGRSIGCMYLREYVDFGDVRDVDFFRSWREDPLYGSLRSGRVDTTCPSCAATSNTGGGCRSAAFAFTGEWTAPDPFCPTTNHGVDLRVLPQRLLSTDA